jgi:hypothetical protein
MYLFQYVNERCQNFICRSRATHSASNFNLENALKESHSRNLKKQAFFVS